MNPDNVIDLAREALIHVVIIASPVLAVAMLTGLLISMLQTLTQIQDQAVSAIPRLLAVIGALAVCLPWMIQRMVDYSQSLIQQIPQTVSGG